MRDGQCHIYLFLVISDARRRQTGFRLSARRLFGVGAIVLSKIIRPESHRRRRGYGFRDDGGESAGHSGRHLPEQNLAGATPLLIAVFNIAVLTAIFFWVPDIRDKAQGSLREQFHFLRSPAPWLIFAATMFGNAGVFAGSAISSHL